MESFSQVAKCSTQDLEWYDNSQWANPHPNTIYSSEVRLDDPDDPDGIYTVFVSFHVSGMRLIFKRQTYRLEQPEETSYYDLGEFNETLCNKLAVDRIKKYAAYVLEGYREAWNLCHCPSFERIDDVDDNFNPIF